MKKAFAALCAVLSLLLSGLPMAASAAPAEPAEIVIHLDETDPAVQPRLKYLVAIFTNLSITDGEANCMANYSTAASRRVQITMTLQRCKTNSSNNSDWSEVETWVKSWYTPGTYIFSKDIAVSSGWYYRVQTVARVLDDSGATLEKVTLYSLVRQY